MSYTDRGGPGGLQSRCGSCTRVAALDRLHRIRDEAFAHYGGSDIRCVCCGESTREFLALDHVNGGGTAARRIAGSGGNVHYVWLRSKASRPAYRSYVTTATAQNVIAPCARTQVGKTAR